MQFKPVFSRFSVIAILLLSLQVSLSQPVSAAACVSQSSGDWATAATWSCGHAPAVGDSAVIQNGHTVTIQYAGGFTSGAWWVDSITIDNGGTFVLKAGINVRTASSFTVNGTLEIQSNGYVDGSSSGVAPNYSSTSTLKYNTGGGYGPGHEWWGNNATGQGVPYNVVIATSTVTTWSSTQYYTQGSLTIDANGTIALQDSLKVSGAFNVNGTLEIKGGGYVNNSGSAPTYSSTTSLLKYNNGSSYSPSHEWWGNTSSGQGVPYHVEVAGGTTVNFGSADYYAQGNVKISGTLTAVSGKKLSLKGNFTNDGTFTHGNGTVEFGGTTQTIDGLGATTFYNLSKTNGGTLNFGSLNHGVTNILTLQGTACTNLITINGSATLNNTGATNTLDFVNVNTPPTLSVAATAANGVPFGGNVAKGWTITTSCVVPIYSSVPAPNAFGMTSTNGTVTTQAINVSNPGTSNLVISSVAWNGIPGSWFSLLSTATPTLGAGVGPAQIANIQCNPGGVKSGSQTAVLRVTHNATGSPVDYTITCTSAAFVGGVAQTIELTTKSTPWGLMILSGVMLLAAGVLMARHRR